MKYKKYLIILLAVLVAGGLIVYKVVTTTKKANEVKMSQATLTLNVADTKQLNLINAKEAISWSSSNKDVATVSSKGVVTGIGKGQTTITAKSDNKEYQSQVTVKLVESQTQPLPAGKKAIYVTIDDGPSAGMQQMLDVLKEKNVKATFFVTGQFKKYFPLIKTAYEQGHAIEAHTYSHNYAIYKNETTYFNDLNKIQDLIVKETGRKATYIRFPGGSSNLISRHYAKGIMKKLAKEVQNRGYKYIDWNVSSGDASGKPLSVNQIVNNCKSSQEVVVLLLHDVLPHSNTVKAFPKIIDYYKSKGYEFVTTYQYDYTCHHPIHN